MKKQLGGDRLGSGNKLNVELHNYERSTHDMGYLWRSTMAAGTLVPFLSEIALPGDTFDINLDCDIKTHPTVGPLFGSFKVQLDIFLAPIRLYQAQLHNDKLGIGLNMASIKLPNIPLHAEDYDITTKPEDFDWDNSQINPSCLLAYLGWRGVGIGHPSAPGGAYRAFNAIPVLMYWDTYKNYYANKQEEIGAVIHTPASDAATNVLSVKINGTTTIPTPPAAPISGVLHAGDVLEITTSAAQDITQIVVSTSRGNHRITELGNLILNTPTLYKIQFDAAMWGNLGIYQWTYNSLATTGAPIQVTTFDLNNIDQMREDILADVASTSAFNIFTNQLTPYYYLQEETAFNKSRWFAQEGLGIKTYQSDLLNNWLQTEWIDGVDGISAITAIDTSGGSFTIDTLNLSKKVYDMLNRIAVSGGSYDDWQDAVWTHQRYTRCTTPMYMGGLIKELVFQEVISQAESGNADAPTQPLGTLAGKGIMGHKHKGGNVTVKVDEPSYIMGIVSITPRIDYSQGNKWDIHLKTLDDVHKPALDEIGFQELITEQMAWWDSHQNADGTWTQKSAGKQPAWLNYMTNVNRVYGNFAIETNEMFMTLNRKYTFNTVGAHEAEIKDLTTYIDPEKYNHIFAQTSLDSQNFWTQIAVNMTARRKMSAKLMPNL